MRPDPVTSAPAPRPRRRSGMTLVEVMVGAGLLTIIATGLVAAFIQNMRMAKTLAYRTQAVTTAMGITEQLRTRTFATVLDAYTTPTNTFDLELVDPTRSDPARDGFRLLQLPINEVDGSSNNAAWTTTWVSMDTTADTPTLPMRFWLRMTRRNMTTTPPCSVIELSLTYQWRATGKATDPWLSENVRIATASP